MAAAYRDLARRLVNLRVDRHLDHGRIGSHEWGGLLAARIDQSRATMPPDSRGTISPLVAPRGLWPTTLVVIFIRSAVMTSLAPNPIRHAEIKNWAGMKNAATPQITMKTPRASRHLNQVGRDGEKAVKP